MYRPHGFLPYSQLQFFEGHLSSKQVLERSHALGVSMTSYLGASFMLAIYHDMPALERKKPICISLPVNLRNYYPSETARNFFNSVCIAHTLTPEDTLETVAPVFDAKLKEVLKPENIRAQMDAYEKLEHIPGIRPVPLVIKTRRSIFTNTGGPACLRRCLQHGPGQHPGGYEALYPRFAAFSSCKTLFTVVCSYGDDLVLGTASALRSTAICSAFTGSLPRMAGCYPVRYGGGKMNTCPHCHIRSAGTLPTARCARTACPAPPESRISGNGPAHPPRIPAV